MIIFISTITITFIWLIAIIAFIVHNKNDMKKNIENLIKIQNELKNKYNDMGKKLWQLQNPPKYKIGDEYFLHENKKYKSPQKIRAIIIKVHFSELDYEYDYDLYLPESNEIKNIEESDL